MSVTIKCLKFMSVTIKCLKFIYVTIKHLKFMSVLLLKAVNSWLSYYLTQVKFHVFYMSLFGSNLVMIKA